MIAINLNINVNVTDQDIDDILSAAFDGATTYWCRKVEVVGDYLGDYASDQISRGGTLKFYDSENDEVYELTKDKFLNGLRLFLNTPTTFGRVVYFNSQDEFCLECGEIDGADADDIVQYALFGEVVYG